MSQTRQTADRLAELATSVVGSAAGATVNRRTGLRRLRATLLRPQVLLAVGLAVVAYALGGRAR
jgi:hypothetical protein